MRKVSLQSLVSFIDSIDAPQEVKDIRDEIVAELAKGWVNMQTSYLFCAATKPATTCPIFPPPQIQIFIF